MQCEKTQHFNYLQIKLPQTVVVNVDKESDRNHVAEQHPVCCRQARTPTWKMVISAVEPAFEPCTINFQL